MAGTLSKHFSPARRLRRLEMLEDCIEADRDDALFTENLEELRHFFADRGCDLDAQAEEAWQATFGD